MPAKQILSTASVPCLLSAIYCPIRRFRIFEICPVKHPLSIRDLVNLLYQRRDVVEFLFGNKDSVNKSEILARADMTDDKLEKLVLYEIIHENNNVIGLDDRVVTFIEEFLEIGEVTTSFINDNIQALEERSEEHTSELQSREKIV